MATVTIEAAQAYLVAFIDKLGPGEDLIILRDNRPVPQLIGLAVETPRPVPGRGRGKLVILAEDDEHLKDFEDDMPRDGSSAPGRVPALTRTSAVEPDGPGGDHRYWRGSRS